ncbi:MAG: carboxypeptidase-like regulatory domain-containing protein, partial [Tannerellaceae bacterium]
MKNKLIAFLLFCSPSLFLGQSKSISGKVFEVITQSESEPIPFANLALVLANDTTSFVAGEISDLNGGYTFKALAGERYILKASFVGYKTVSHVLDLTDSKTTQLVQDVLLEQDQIALNEVVIKGNRSSQSIDKTVFTFSTDEIKKAYEGRELVSTLPNLRINHIGNSLATVDGKSI